MPLPANVTTVTVLGTFLTPEGNPSTGTVSFTPSSWLLNSGANIAIPNSPVVKTLGTAGDFSAVLPITDDADLSPGGWVYSVSEVVDGVSQSYNIAIPGTVAAGGTVFLADLAPVAPAGPEYYSLASSLAIGTVTKIAPGGNPTATITGLAPSQTLNLGLVTGDTGSVSTLGTGSAGTAAISPTGDANTGFFFPAADTVAVTTGGSERVRVNSSGQVGIGTSSPVNTLHVNRDATTTVRVQQNSTDTEGPTLFLVKQRGTAASPTVVSSGDVIGRVDWLAWSGDARRQVANIAAIADGTVTTTSTPGYLSFSTTPSGSTSSTERMRIDSNGLITGTGTSLGAWTAYTPTIGGTGWAIGNGTITAGYCQIGKTVHFKVYLKWGSTSTFGSGSLTLTPPINRVAGYWPIIPAAAYDISAAQHYTLLAVGNAAGTITVLTNASPAGAVISTSPFTWAVDDTVELSGTIEIA